MSATLLQDAGVLVSWDTGTRTGRALLSATGASRLEHAPTTRSTSTPGHPDVLLRLEDEHRPFDLTGFTPVTRGVWAGPEGETVLESTGGSGFAQHWSMAKGQLLVRSRWVPSLVEAAAASVMRTRFRALRAQVLLHYPVLWWAATRGLAPLHVSVLEIDGVAVLLAGPGGVGKSSLVARELDTGASATCDNLGVCDGELVHGLRERLRVPAEMATRGSTARAAHGRREQPWHGWVPEIRPALVVVVRRGLGPHAEVRPTEPATARRALVGGTFCAGELRRFWPLAATLAVSTGRDPVLPPVDAVAGVLTERLPCFELVLGAEPGPPLRTLLHQQLATATGGVLR
jgi:hypothetical protein